MSAPERFDPDRGLIVVPARIGGPVGEAVLRLALDTGATKSILRVEHLVALGYDPASAKDRLRLTTAGGVRTAPLVEIMSMQALGCTRYHFSVLAHTLPSSTSVDGLLRLDFLRGKQITIDMRRGRVRVS